MVEPQFLQKFKVTTFPDSVLFSYFDSSPEVKVTLSSGNQTWFQKRFLYMFDNIGNDT